MMALFRTNKEPSSEHSTSPPSSLTVIREAIGDAPPKLVMLALSDLLQEHLTRLVTIEPDKQQTDLSPLRERLLKVLS